MRELAGPRMPVPDGATIAALVEAQVERTPDAPALVHSRETLTYRDLDARATTVARSLADRGVGPGVPVGVCTGRSPELAVALLAVLKAGGACLPLDPSYPASRLAAMLDDARPPVVLVDGPHAARVPAGGAEIVRVDGAAGGAEVVRLDGAAAAARPPAGRSGPRATPADLAYLLYTSGSTGAPKGVMLPHRGLVNHNLAAARMYGLGPGDRVLQFCSISFDVSIEELFPTWQSGATVVLRPDDAPVLGQGWSDWLERQDITVLNLPTAYWHEWVRDLHRRGARLPGCVRLVVVGGERALGGVYRSWLEVGGDRVRWVNAYGPAETSVLATAYEPPAGGHIPGDRDPPIGRPLANTLVRILDRDGRPVAAGDDGELYIGGAGLALGYLNQPELTARRFVPDPFADRDGARLYRTGDLVRLLEDGNLEFVGRRDQQVKIRGFRIECAEVTSALTRHPRVSEAVVGAYEPRPGDRRLVAHVVPGGAPAPSPAALRAFLAERLPVFMLPSAFVLLDALPTTPNGKVDRDRLPPPGDPRDDLGTAYRAPRTAAEAAVADVWSQVLGLDQIGVDDDFFDLGGHSLLATQIVADLRQRIAVDLGVGALLDSPTVAGLAATVEGLRGAGEAPPPLVPRPRRAGQPFPLSLSQEQMWALEASADPPGLFNVTALHRFDGPVGAGTVRRALAHLAERHETLRTYFVNGPEGPAQTVVPAVDVDVEVTDLFGAATGALHEHVARQDGTPFDPAEPPLFRAGLYRLDGGASVLATTFDHLVCDGTSAYVFLTEVAAACEALAAGDQPRLRPLAVQYPDFALWQREWLTGERLQAQLAYWQDRLAGMPLGPAVPFDTLPERPTRHIEQRALEVGGPVYRRLTRLARDTRSTMFVVAAAAVQALFARACGRTDVVLSTTLSGRQHAALEGLIGCFHGVGRIRTDLSGNPSFNQVVARTRSSVLGLFEHQDIPFMRVRRAVLPDFPAGGRDLLAAVPTEFQYFHTAHDEWAPGRGVVEHPGEDPGPDRLFFRGHLHPMLVTFLDDGSRLWGEFSYKTDFYETATIERLAAGLGRLLDAVTEDAGLALGDLPAGPVASPA